MHQKSAIALVLVLAAAAVNAFPTKVKLLKAPDLASSEGAEVRVTTNKGKVAVSSTHPAYKALSSAKAGQCLNLETESESTVDFNQKVDESGLRSVQKTRC